MQIAGLRSKLTYMEKDLEITTQKLEDAVRTSTALQAVVNSLNGTAESRGVGGESVSLYAHICAVDGLQEELNAAEKRVQDLERKRDHMVDSIFKSFCKQVGIKNIREYEVRFMLLHMLSAGVTIYVFGLLPGQRATYGARASQAAARLCQRGVAAEESD